MFNQRQSFASQLIAAQSSLCLRIRGCQTTSRIAAHQIAPQARCACLCTRSAHSRAPLTPNFERLGKRHNGVSVGETPIGTSTVRVLCVDGDRRIGYSPGLLHPSLCGLGQRGTLDGRRHLVQTRKQRFVRRCSLSTYIPARHQCQQNSNSQPGR